MINKNGAKASIAAFSLMTLLAGSASAADKVVIIPLGATVGNATAADVVMGKTFSSKRAGKGVTGTLEVPPAALSFYNRIGMKFNQLPAGFFIMGSYAGADNGSGAEPGRIPNETQHQVTLTQSFYMQTTEVTNEQWDAMIEAIGFGTNPSQSHSDGNYPIDSVTWSEAVYFANWLSRFESRDSCYVMSGCNERLPGSGLYCAEVTINENCSGYRLPTEAEWEYAARAGTTTAYANPVYFDSTNTVTNAGFNSNLDAMGWYTFNGAIQYPAGSKPVGAKQANRWGLYDMHGNVWEWCQDFWDGSEAYSPDPVTDPQGPETSGNHILRGGSWETNAKFLRSAYRGKYPKGMSFVSAGFRLASSSGE